MSESNLEKIVYTTFVLCFCLGVVSCTGAGIYKEWKEVITEESK